MTASPASAEGVRTGSERPARGKRHRGENWLNFFLAGEGGILIFKALGKGSWEKRSLLKRAFISGVSEGRMPSK